MNKTTSTMLGLIGAELFGVPVDVTALSTINADEWRAIYCLASCHDMAQIVGNALLKSSVQIDASLHENFKSSIATAIYRYTTQKVELEKIKAVFLSAGIPFVVLKGWAIRKYYAKPWVRTSCDIDILVHKDDISRARIELENKLNYKHTTQNFHEISFSSASGVHLELHFSISEHNKKMDSVLFDCWNYANPIANVSSEYCFTEEFSRTYIVAHAANHFMGGGCGIRPIVDLYMLEKSEQLDECEFARLLETSGLTQFYCQMMRIAHRWFDNTDDYDESLAQIEEYIIKGGMYGTQEQAITIGTAHENSIKYILGKAWLPYNELKCIYPTLEGKKLLLPAFEIRRWFGLFTGQKRSSVVGEIKKSLLLESDIKDKTKKMIDKLGLENKT